MTDDKAQEQPTEEEQSTALKVLEHRLTARIARLERANRRKRWVTGALLVGLAGSLALSAAAIFDPSLVAGVAGTREEVRSRGFVLQDGQGNERGSWRIVEDGSVRLSISDAEGQPRMNLTVREDGAPGISFADDTDSRRVVLGLLPDQTGTLVFADGEGVPRAVLGVSGQGSASLLFADAQGSSRVSLGLDAAGTGSLVLPERSPPQEGE